MLTRQGWFVTAAAAGFVVAGRLLGSLELFVVGITMALLVLCCVIYVALSRLRIDVTRELHPPRVHAGAPSRVDLRVENIGRRPTPVLGLRDAVSGTRGANLLVGPLAGAQVERAAYRLPTDRRGILEIGPLRVEMSDPFGISRITMTASGVSELTVYPHIDAVVPVPLTSGNDPMAGAEHPNALGRAGEDFYALRHYQVGDDLRRVHWPSTAKHDELMVRQDEQPWQGRATVLCDVRAATNTEESLELVISAAASVVTASARRQDLVRLLTTNGSDSGFAAGHAHVEAIMETLVSAELSHDAAFRRVIDRAARSSTGGALIALVANMPPNEIERLSRLRQRFGSVTIVQFDPSSWDPQIAPTTIAPPTGVLRVTSRASFLDTWDTAMQGPTRRRTRDEAWRNRPYDATIPPADDSFDPFARRGGVRP